MVGTGDELYQVMLAQNYKARVLWMDFFEIHQPIFWILEFVDLFIIAG
jgi:hypothetical protein